MTEIHVMIFYFLSIVVGFTVFVTCAWFDLGAIPFRRLKHSQWHQVK